MLVMMPSSRLQHCDGRQAVGNRPRECCTSSCPTPYNRNRGSGYRTQGTRARQKLSSEKSDAAPPQQHDADGTHIHPSAGVGWSTDGEGPSRPIDSIIHPSILPCRAMPCHPPSSPVHTAIQIVSAHRPTPPAALRRTILHCRVRPKGPRSQRPSRCGND